ncbi:MAG TPA: hypothetical protein VFH71_04380 [Rhodanobacteraceae bacterium]|nr:hypothetical protein [Rhodanobacteraceae bacterium]
MRMRFMSAYFVLLAATAAMPALAGDGEQVYLLFANTSSHPFQVKGMTVGGKPCAACADRTIAPGAVAMVKIGDLGSNHLKLAITGDGSGTCNYDFGSDGNSESGDCGSNPKIAYTSGVHSDFMFDTRGTPSFNLFYAYDPPKGQ